MKRTNLLFLLALLLLGSASPSLAAKNDGFEAVLQNISGHVVDSRGQPLIGASVQVKGTSLGTVTDFDGNFNLNVNDPATAVFVVSYTGFATQEVAVAGQRSVSVTMSEVGGELSQIVVVGYGTQSRKQTTGAISQVRGEDLAKQPYLTPIQAIQGLAPGIRVVGSGAPGTQPRVTIRGLNTILTNENPLYVVDGVITSDITNVNMADVVSVDVLKDGAAAIYGTRGSNGVIVITTRKGKSGKISVSLDAYRGFRQLTGKVKMANAAQYKSYTEEARKYDGQDPLTYGSADTDWFDEITQKGTVQSYTLSASGGSENASFLFSAGWFGDEGILKGADFSRITLRSNNEFSIRKNLRLGNNLSVSIPKTTGKPTGAFTDAYRMSPAAPVIDPLTKTYGSQDGLSVSNPVASLELANDFTKALRLQGNLYGEWDILNGLKFRSSWGFDRDNSNNQLFRPKYNYGIYTSSITELKIKDAQTKYWVWDNILSYSKTFGESQLDLMAGHSSEDDRAASTQFRITGVPDDRNLWYLAQGDPASLTLLEDLGSHYTRESFFGRANYAFQNKYNLSATVRRDGSSAFPTSQKWGNFYSIGASWILSEEEFLKSMTIFDYLKLRGGYAVLGNDNFSRIVNNNLSQLSPISNTNPYGFPSGLVSGITVNQVQDALATWETTKGFDLGAEFGLATRISGEISYYNKLTKAYIKVPTPSFVDVDGILSQAADVRNKGVEIGLKWTDRTSADFSYHIGANLTFNKNNVEKVRGGIDLKEGGLGNGEVTTSTVEGKPIGSFWVYETNGIYKNEGEIKADSTAVFYGTLPGDFRYKDQNGDKVLDERDRVFVGSYQPKFYYGLSGGFNWKMLDFSIDCYGNAGNKIYNGKKGVRFGNDNVEAVRDGRWTASNTGSSEPRASNSIPKPSTYFVESGNFFRINNITLGYTLPKMERSGLNRIRVYVSAQNPVISKKFSGFSPELPGSNALNSGIELSVYPTLATYLFGFNLGF